MIVPVAWAMLLLPRLVARPVIVSGMIVGCDPFTETYLELAKRRTDFVLVRPLAIVFDADRSAGARARLDNAGHRAERVADGACPAFVRDPRHLPDGMAVAFGDLGACRTYHLAQTRQRQLGGVKMDAQCCRGVTVDRDDVGLFDTVARRQGGDEAIQAGVGGIGQVGQQHRNVEFELVVHDGLPTLVFGRMRAKRHIPYVAAVSTKQTLTYKKLEKSHSSPSLALIMPRL